jgi:hypothetical protein
MVLQEATAARYGDPEKKKETGDDNTNLTVLSCLLGRGAIVDSYAEIVV